MSDQPARPANRRGDGAPVRPRLLAVGVLVVVVATGVGVWLVTRDSGSSSGIATAGGTSAPAGSGGSDPRPGSVAASELWGHRWTITGVRSDARPTGGVAPRTDGSPPVLDLTTVGTVAFSGCNGGRGGGRLEGEALVVDGMASTRLACGGPDGQALMAQDAALIQILEAGPSVAIDGDALTLTAPVGTITATRAG